MNKYEPYEQNIISFIGEINYTFINPLDGRVAIYAKTLKKFELELSEQKQFVRVNKSVIVNLLFVNKYKQRCYRIMQRNDCEGFQKKKEKTL